MGSCSEYCRVVCRYCDPGNLHEALATQNALGFLRQASRVTLAQAQDMVRDLKLGEPAARMPLYLLELQH